MRFIKKQKKKLTLTKFVIQGLVDVWTTVGLIQTKYIKCCKPIHNLSTVRIRLCMKRNHKPDRETMYKENKVSKILETPKNVTAVRNISE